MLASPSRREYTRDVSEIDLQAYKDVENIAFYQVPSNMGSGLSMENETSLRVHICTEHNDVNFLERFLHNLVEYKENYKHVMNLLFHGIEWRHDGVQLLCSFLAPGSSVKQLEFQKNVFSTKSAVTLLPLSEMLQKNNIVKSIVFLTVESDPVELHCLHQLWPKTEVWRSSKYGRTPSDQRGQRNSPR
jgi:hypothetical protein